MHGGDVATTPGDERREAAPNPARTRLVSLDLLRGLVVLLMLFVNQADSVEGVPAFLRHAGEDADAVTLADVVLPAFLFMAGMSVPLALRPRLARGVGTALAHVLSRAAALLVMGVLLVNADLARADGPLSPAAWGALAVLGAMAIWQAPPQAPERRRAWLGVRAAGVLLVVGLVLAYRGADATGIVQIRPHWWGILGILGWAYLTASLLYLLVGERPLLLVGAVALLNGLYYLEVLRQPSWLPLSGIGSLVGSQGAVAVAGTALGVMVARHAREGGSPWRLAGRGLALGVALLLAGTLLHHARPHEPAFDYNKDNATPPWGLVSAATTAIAWVAVYAAADGAGSRRWPPLLRIVGTQPLLTYLLEPLVLALLAASAAVFGRNPWTYVVGTTTTSGLLAAALFACLLGHLAGLLARAGLRLRL